MIVGLGVGAILGCCEGAMVYTCRGIYRYTRFVDSVLLDRRNK